MKNITEALNWRYSTKLYDENKKISEENFKEIENILRLSPTSTNLQPLKFIVAETDEAKKRIAKATKGFYSFNEGKVLSASHVIIFASKVITDEEHLKDVIEKEDKDGRFEDEEIKIQQEAGRRKFLDVHRFYSKDEAQWNAKQSYITLGALLLGAAELGIDATAMEGLDTSILEEEFDLNKDNFAVNFIVALGYRKDGDFNASLNKSRLDKEKLINRV
ncbi:MAG: oxygen-insensitive NAD(P)H nitroreductase [Peptoniphilaceae bacterium]